MQPCWLQEMMLLKIKPFDNILLNTFDKNKFIKNSHATQFRSQTIAIR